MHSRPAPNSSTTLPPKTSEKRSLIRKVRGGSNLVSSNLEQYAVADFLEWHAKKQLKLNPDFQRQSVWPPQAKSYLIDTVLRKLPIPKIYMRTSVDISTQRTYREIVDGQQRLRSLIDFAEDKFALGSRAQEFRGLRYSTLSDEQKETFLSYRISVDQLINASDDDVLEIFSRLNSYTVPVNAPELRHAKFQTDFKWAVHDSSNRWSDLWEGLQVISPRERVRLMSDSLMAEMFGIVLEGVRDGGQPKINALYERYKGDFDPSDVNDVFDVVLPLLLEGLSPPLIDTPLHSAPHFLMIFAAASYSLVGIPHGDVEVAVKPAMGMVSVDEVSAALYELGRLIEQDTPHGNEAVRAFWRASKSSTQRIASRRVRFPAYLAAFEGRLPF